jgi:hypothetical protein
LKLLRVCSFLLLLSCYAGAQTLTGTVTNGTNDKPAASVQVTLLQLAGGMHEAGSTKTDARGNFSLKLPDGGPHLVRANYQGAPYFRMAPPGTTSVEVQVYDAAQKVEGMSYTVDVLKLQTEGDQLRITRLFAVNNESKPPRTQVGESNFQFLVPEGAVLDTSMAKSPGGQPVSVTVTLRGKNAYSFAFPLRPGETQMQVAYHLPYPGSTTIDPKSVYPLQHLVVMLPKSMQFEAQTPAVFQTMQNGPGVSNAIVQVAQQTQPGQSLAFNVSGTGTLPEESQGGGPGGGEAQTSGGTMPGRPGGGLGAPIDAPDPLHNFRWWLLGGFAVILAGLAYYVTNRSREASVETAEGGVVSIPFAARSEARSVAAPVPAAPTAPAPAGGLLLQALKEELFQLELDRQQGRITPAEYEKHKTALDHTLQRAVKRGSGS